MFLRVVIALLIGTLISACAQDRQVSQRIAASPKAGSQLASACPKKTSCDQMVSCSEAVYHLVTCHQYQLDRNTNGVPCERLCGKTLDDMQARMKAAPYAPR